MGKGSPENHTTANTQASKTNVRFEVTNFGPIKSGAIDLRPLTVFVGPSNTGKTYFAVLIYALHRILSGFPRLPVMHYSRYHHRLLFESRKPSRMDSAIQDEELQILLTKLDADGRDLKLSDFPNGVRKAITMFLEHPELLQNDVEEEIIRCFDIDSVSHLTRLSENPNKTNVSMVVSEEDQDLWRFHMNLSESGISADGQVEDIVLFPKGWRDAKRIHASILRLRSMMDSALGSTRSRPAGWPLFEEFVEGLLSMITGTRRVKPLETYYLPAARSGIMQSHRVIASSLVKRSTRAGLERFPELPTFSGVIADFMQRLILYRESRPNNRSMNALADQLEREALAGKIRTKRPSPGGYPEFVYRPRNIEQDIRLSRASSMVSELAPIILFLRGAIGRGDTLIIEEPEAHLHPAAQTQMAATLARMVRAGVRVVVTTHSDWLLKEIGNLMREGALGEQIGQPSRKEELPSSLRPSEVGIWLFRKDGAASGSTVEEIPFDRSEGIEPQDYEEVAEELYNRSADLQNRLEETAGGLGK